MSLPPVIQKDLKKLASSNHMNGSFNFEVDPYHFKLWLYHFSQFLFNVKEKWFSKVGRSAIGWRSG